MPTLRITWRSMRDDSVCKICKALDGYTWIFVTGKDIMTDALWHPQFGIVWSLAQGSNAHARGYLSGQTHNCRCRIEPEYNLEDILAKCVYLRELVQPAMEE